MDTVGTRVAFVVVRKKSSGLNGYILRKSRALVHHVGGTVGMGEIKRANQRGTRALHKWPHASPGAPEMAMVIMSSRCAGSVTPRTVSKYASFRFISVRPSTYATQCSQPGQERERKGGQDKGTKL